MIKNYLQKNWLTILFLSILVFLTYGNSLNNVFLSDDIAEIVQNPNIGNFSNILTRPFGFIRLIFYWLAFQTGGLNPAIFRFINIFFHIGSVFLIYFLFNLKSKKLAIIIASIFAVHPAISEAVVWISGGSYPQYAFFFLASLLFYIKSAKKKFLYILSITFYVLSLMSHPQMPLSLFLIFPLWELSSSHLKQNWKKSIPFLLIAIAFAFLTLTSIPERETTLKSIHYQERGMDNIFILIPVALSSYFELALFPKVLTLYHSELAFTTIEFVIRAILTIAFFAAILISFFKNKFIFFWLCFFIIALSPTLTPFRLNWVVAERYLYLPILGFLAIFGYGFEKITSLKSFKQISLMAVVSIIIALSARTIVRNIDWKNEDNLWIATGKTSPSSPNTHNNLGDVYGRQGNKLLALKEFQKAIELKPNYGDAYHNLANTYMELGEVDKALENYQNALKFNPNLWQSYQNIAAIYFQQKNYSLAIEYLQKAAQINPKNLNIKNNIGIAYLLVGEKEKAKEIFSLVLSVDPKNKAANQGLLEINK